MALTHSTFEELFDLSIGTVFESNSELETIEELQEIYKDGVLLETAFNSSIFIPKDSIAYIKISKTNKK